MKTKTKELPKELPKTQPTGCLCQGAGPLLSEVLRRIGPPETARRHFDAAAMEFLKGLRAVLDARIAERERGNTKGEKIQVE
jgi:hypothetical protein